MPNSDQTAPVRFGPVQMTWLDRRVETMPWGFELTFDQHNEANRCRLTFDAREYDPALVRRLLERFVRLLVAISLEPERPLAALLSPDAGEPGAR